MPMVLSSCRRRGFIPTCWSGFFTPPLPHFQSCFILWEQGDFVEYMSQPPNKSPGQPPLARSVPLSRFTSQVGGGSAFYVRPHSNHQTKNCMPKNKETVTNRYNMGNGKFVIIGAKRALTVPEMQKIVEDWLIAEKKAAAQAVEDRFLKSKSNLI